MVEEFKYSLLEIESNSQTLKMVWSMRSKLMNAVVIQTSASRFPSLMIERQRDNISPSFINEWWESRKFFKIFKSKRMKKKDANNPIDVDARERERERAHIGTDSISEQCWLSDRIKMYTNHKEPRLGVKNLGFIWSISSL